MQIVYAYGGAMLYCEFMSEMRRPLDFIKAQFVAEIFIYLCYLIFGLVLYSQQGQLYVYLLLDWHPRSLFKALQRSVSKARQPTASLSLEPDTTKNAILMVRFSTYNPANQGLSPYSWQTVTNALSLVSGIIAAVLYGNIGIKVIYQNIVQDLFGGPELTTKKGKIFWVFMVPMYWSAAFVIASAVSIATFEIFEH
jgi:hypothetical protein